MEVPAPEAPRYRFADITPAQWQALAQRRMYFGHQSVGGNIMDGVKDVLAANPSLGIRVVEATDLDSSAAPGLYHGRIGRNGDPGAKLAAVVGIADHGAPSVAMVKYCYVDVTMHTSADSLFAQYQEQITALKQRHPGLIVVHMTMPLTSIGGRREIVNDWLGRDNPRRLNAIRARYNELMRRAYAGKEPLFDVARFESTRPDGSRTSFTRRGHTVHYLADDYTEDGGHISPAARRAVAEEFLATLASL